MSKFRSAISTERFQFLYKRVAKAVAWYIGDDVFLVHGSHDSLSGDSKTKKIQNNSPTPRLKQNEQCLVSERSPSRLRGWNWMILRRTVMQFVMRLTQLMAGDGKKKKKKKKYSALI
eukprot:Selendium_serpulae@DN657_c0_g1_i1.p1